MFDIGPLEVVVLVIAAVLLFGPEKLPDLARKAARVISYVRNIANNAQAQISSELGPEFADFDIRDPKGSIRRHIMDQVDPIVTDVKEEIGDTKKVFGDAGEDLASVRDDLAELTGRDTPSPVDEPATTDAETSASATSGLAATSEPTLSDSATSESTLSESTLSDSGTSESGTSDAVASQADDHDGSRPHDAPASYDSGEPVTAGAPYDPDAT